MLNGWTSAAVRRMARYWPKKLPMRSSERPKKKISKTMTGTSSPVEIQ